MSKWINKIKKWTTPHVISVYLKVVRIIRKTNLLPSVRALPERFNWLGRLALHMGGTLVWPRVWKLSTSIHLFLLLNRGHEMNSCLTLLLLCFHSMMEYTIQEQAKALSPLQVEYIVCKVWGQFPDLKTTSFEFWERRDEIYCGYNVTFCVEVWSLTSFSNALLLSIILN